MSRLLPTRFVGGVERRRTARRREMERADRIAKCLDLRRQGYSYDEIGREVGISKANAHKLTVLGLEALPRESAEEVRKLEAERLDALTRATWGEASAGELDAVAAQVKLSERRSKLLGLDAPQKQDVNANVMAVTTDLDAFRSEVVETVCESCRAKLLARASEEK